MGVDVAKAEVFPEKDPGATLDYAVNFEQECARKWEPFKDFTSTLRIRVYPNAAGAGFEFECTTAGRTGGRPPQWPSVVGQTVSDGSVTWTCRALSTSSLKKTVSGTPTWSADTGVTVSNSAITGQTATANIAGGTDGQDYTIVVTATFSDSTSLPKVVVLPVRRARRVA